MSKILLFLVKNGLLSAKEETKKGVTEKYNIKDKWKNIRQKKG